MGHPLTPVRPSAVSAWPHAGGIMAARIRNHDWSSTPLGPIGDWPATLRFAIDQMLSFAFPTTVQWGTNLRLFYNDAYIPLIESRHPHALGRPILETFPEIASIYVPFAERVLEGETLLLKDQVFRYTRHLQPDDFWFDLSYSPVREADGSVAGIMAIGFETTEKRRAELARAQSDLRLQRLMETEAVGMIFFDAEAGAVIGANEVFLRMSGHSRSDLESRKMHWRTLTPPEWIAVSEAQWSQFRQTGRIGPYEKEYFCKDGSRRWILVAGRDLGDGTLAEYAIDITDRKLAEAALLRNEKLATLGRLAASIAHEINNPLEATTNLLYLARTTESLPEQARQYLTVAEGELNRVAHITRQSLGFYRETSQPKEISLPDLLEASIDLLHGKIVNKDARIVRQWEGDLRVRAVPGELRQVFSNLLTNSLDAIAPGGSITIRARLDSGNPAPMARISIADSGCGIDAAKRNRVFDPFFSTKGDLGNGLGLWVTAQIVEKHHGWIRLRSRTDPPRKGTTVTVALPA